MVIVIDADKVSKLEVTCHTSSLTCNTFHSASITKNAICMVIDNFKARLIEYSCGMCLSNSKTNGIAEALTEWTGGNFDSGGIMRFGMSGSNAVYLLSEI
jgi:hypothetical protein